MRSLSKDKKKRIYADWARALPGYTKVSAYMFVKRNGVILTGVYLHPSSEEYVPQFTSHSLLNPFCVIPLTGIVKLHLPNGANRYVSYEEHLKDFDSIVAEFKAICPVMFQEDASLSMLNQYYTYAISKLDMVSGLRVLEDHLTFLAWHRLQSELSVKIEEYKGVVAKYEQDWIKQFKKEDSDNWQANWKESYMGRVVTGWDAKIAALTDRSTMEQRLEEQIDTLKLAKLKDFGVRMWT